MPFSGVKWFIRGLLHSLTKNFFDVVLWSTWHSASSRGICWHGVPVLPVSLPCPTFLFCLKEGKQNALNALVVLKETPKGSQHRLSIWEGRRALRHRQANVLQVGKGMSNQQQSALTKKRSPKSGGASTNHNTG